MTLEDLQKHLCILGGVQEIEVSPLLITSLNRALRRFHNDIVIPKEVRLAARKLTVVSHYDQIIVKSGDLVDIPVPEGSSYCMRVHGIGKYMVTDGDSFIAYSIDSPNEAQLIKGFVSYGGKLSFWGGFSFVIQNLTVYGEILSPELTDIPEYNARRVFDFRAMFGDFMAFHSYPTDANSNPIPDSSLHDGKLEINPDYEGEILIAYRRLPKELLVSDATQYIDVPDEYLHLFRLLAAAYYLDYVEQGLAKEYMTLYEEALKSLKGNLYTHINPKYVDTNGWA